MSVIDFAKARLGAQPEFDRGDHVEIVSHLKNKYPDLVYDEGSLWKYNEARGVWERGIDRELAHTIAGYAGAPVGVADKKGNHREMRIRQTDVKGSLEMLSSHVAKPDYFSSDLGFACRNGYFHISNGNVNAKPHAKENRARGYADIDLTASKADGPFVTEFLPSLFAGTDDAADRIALLQEFLGGALFGLSTKYQRCLVMVGGGSDGKSALISILQAAFPAHAWISLSPERWGERFGSAGLVGARLNLVSELPADSLLQSSVFKAVITGDAITGEIKNGSLFPFCPRAGHLFASNGLPRTKDQSEGFWRRFMVVEFPRNFEREGCADRSIVERMVRDDLAGVLRWLVEGAMRLLANKGYTVPTSHTEQLARWRDESDSVRAFLKSLPVGKIGAAEDLFERYGKWAMTNGVKFTVSQTEFGRRAKQATDLVSWRRTEVTSAFYTRI